MTAITTKTEQHNAEELFADETRIAATCEFPALRQRLATLSRLLAGKNRLIVVTGEAGAGKSTALRIFIAGLELPWKKCRIHRPLPPVDTAPVTEEAPPISACIIESSQPVLVIDDAHELAAGELAFLLRSCNRKHNRFRKLVLFAEPGINALLAAIESMVPGNMELDRIFLPSLGAEETAAYLARLLTAAGVARNPFRPKAILAIHRASGGVFGRINTEAQERLKKKPASRPPFAGLHIWSVALLFVVLLGVAAAVLVRDIQKIGHPPRSGIGQAQPGTPAMPARQGREAATPTSPPAPAAIVPATAPQERTVTPLTAAPKPPVPPANLPPKTPAVLAVSPAAPAPQAEPATNIRREKWLLSRAPAMYTIQIMAVSKEDILFAAIDQHRLWQQVAYYRTRRNDGDWYPLLYGLYASRDEAKAALATLPPALRAASPWPRRLADIQAAIRSKAQHR